MRIEVVRAWPGRCERVELDLPSGALVGDAVRESRMDAAQTQAADADADADAIAVAVFGVVTSLQAKLHDGDRVELLRPLLIDPKQARRRRAKGGKAPR